MDWGTTLILMLAVLMVILLSGIPVAFAFLLFNLLGTLYLMGPNGIEQISVSIFSSVSKFVIAPVPLFILMGTIMFHSGMAKRVIDGLADIDRGLMLEGWAQSQLFSTEDFMEGAQSFLMRRKPEFKGK